MLKVLFISPLPPPVTGHSHASETLLNELRMDHDVRTVNFSKGTFKQGVSSLGRIFDVVKILNDIRIKSRGVDVIYLTISQSIAGNLKDIVTYLLCFNKLDHMIIHLHGGGIRKRIFDRFSILHWLNRFFTRRLGAAIVLGKSLTPVFDGLVPAEKIHIVPNFADEDIFLNHDNIKEKFSNAIPLRILFLSNLIHGKGYEELLAAYEALDDNTRKNLRIDFAGDFENRRSGKIFLDRIEGMDSVRYHGVVRGDKKKRLFARAHAFCLPTYYAYEGQPISILEAYAAGCVVLTTDHGGIRDIFSDGVNGFMVQKRSVESLATALQTLVKESRNLLPIALANQAIASREYRKHLFVSRTIKIIESFDI